MNDPEWDLRLRSLILVIGLALLLSFFAVNESSSVQTRPVAQAAPALPAAAAQAPEVVGNDTIAAMIAAENAALAPITYSATIPIVFR